jgi:ADP-ribose pyrophosphatase YjhB (NUDIX family)
MTLVGEFYESVNRGDAAEVASFYDDACQVELTFDGDTAPRCGRDRVAEGWRDEFAVSAPALPGDRRYDVTRVGGIETGWGWVRADWTRGRQAAGAPPRVESGYAYFWIEDGRIVRQRTIVGVSRPVAAPPAAASSPDGRRYPARPVVGVGAVIFNDRGEVLLVRRKHEPLALQWSLPGGGLDPGETLQAGTAREVLEETGLTVTVGPLIEVFDRILLDDEANVRYHFVLVDYLCHWTGGTPRPASDVSECVWAPVEPPGALDRFGLAEKPRDVIARAVVLARTSA